MDFDEDSYANQVRLVPDVLDSPILKTTRDDILKAVNRCTSIYQELESQGVSLNDMNPYAIERAIQSAWPSRPEKKGSVRFSSIERDAMRFVSCAWMGERYRLLEEHERFEVIDRAHNILASTTLTSSVDDALALYSKMRFATQTQLGLSAEGPSPLPAAEILDRHALQQAELYHNASAHLEKIVHYRQAEGLKNRPGKSVLRSPDSEQAERMTIANFGEIVIFRLQSTLWLSSWDDFLCIRSMALFRRNAYLLCVCDPQLAGVATNLTRLLDWQRKCIQRYSNPGYELAKATESVFKARMMQIADGPYAGDAFELMIAKQRTKEESLAKKLGSMSTPLVDQLEDFAQEVSDIRVAAELFGSLKFSGHPVIDPRLASKSSKEHGTSKSTANFAEAMLMRGQFCEMILVGHIKKHGRWPSLHFSHHCRLKELYHQKFLGVGPGTYDLKDWMWTRFEPFLDFDYHIDYLDLMDDKSTSLDAKDAWKAWDALRREDPKLAEVPDTRSKKLMIRLLAMPEFDPKKICDEIRTMDLSVQELCMALYPKEREFKLEARLFVMLSFSVRFYLALAEKNFKRLMKDYLDEQSMTKGRKGTMQYLEKLSAIRRDDDIDSLFIEIDLSRWNLQWRGDVVNPISRVADSIFGLPGAFSRGHDLFEASTIVVRMASDLPPGITQGSLPSQWPTSHYVWRGHKGGFEGIIQGQWTACTQAELKLIMRDEPIVGYKLLGQGDNQIVSVVYKRDHGITPQEQAKLVSDRITRRLELRFSMVNQIVKPEECLVSRNVVTYSKILWANGVQIPTTLKHAATVAPVGTSQIPSLMVGLEGISSGCRASADAFSNPGFGYLYFLILFRDFLKRASSTMPASGLISSYSTSRRALDIMSLLPSDLGGLPTQSVSDFLFGGCSDRLSASISNAVLASYFSDDFKHLLGYLESSLPWKKKPSLKGLLEDPFGVPIDRNPGADVKIEAAMATVLPVITKNRDVAPIVSHQVTDYDHSLSKFLTSTKPFYPLLMADIRELSIVGVRKKIQTKFVGTRTVQGLMRRSAPINYRETVLSSDMDRLHCAHTTMLRACERKLTSKFPARAIFSRAENYRARWSPDGSTQIVGVTTLHPFEATLDLGLKRESPDYLEFLLPTPGSTALTTRGEFAGRWGDRTWEHRKPSGVQVLGTQKSALAAKRLLLLESQLAATGNLQEAIRSVLRQRTTFNESILSDLMPTVIGGAAAHRWDSTIEDKAFAWLGPVGITQHVAVQTDAMSSASGGVKDWAFCFQEHIFFGLQIMRTEAEIHNQTRAFRLHYSLMDEHQIKSREVEVVNSQCPVVDLSGLQENPLLCASDILFQALSTEMPGSFAPVIPITQVNSSVQVIRLMAHYFLDQLENPRLSELALSGTDPPAGLSLDVGTVLGAGLKNLVEAAGVAVFMRSCEIAVNMTNPQARAAIFSPATAINELSLVAALPLARFANAPGVRDQRWVRESGILVGPGSRGFSQLINSLTAKIRSQAYHQWSNIPKVAPMRLILSSSAERATPSRVLGCLIGVFMIALANGNVNAARKLYRRHHKEMMKGGDEASRLSAHIHLLNCFTEVNEHVTSRFAELILQGRFLCRVTNSFDESVRYLRRLEPAKNPVITGNLDLDVVGVWERHSNLPKQLPVAPSELAPLSIRFSKKSMERELLYRNVLWPWGASSISRQSLPVFAGIRKEIAGCRIGIVGVGMGAMARDLLALGARSVTGLELLSDFPKASGLGTSYLPPEIPVGLSQNRWRWHPAVFLTGGNWFDSETSQSYLTEKYDTIVIDIQGGVDEPRFGLRKIEPLLRAGFHGVAVFRETLTTEEYFGICRVLRSSFLDSSVRTTVTGCGEAGTYWFSVLMRGETHLFSGFGDISVPPNSGQLNRCPNPHWYPSCVAKSHDYLLRGRCDYDLESAQMISFLGHHLEWSRSHNHDRQVERELSLGIHVLHHARLIPKPIDSQEALITILEDLTGSEIQEMTGGYRTTYCKQSLVRNAVIRHLARILELTGEIHKVD